MTAAEIETDVCIIGMPEGKETSEVLRYLQSKEIRCCVYSPGEAADVVAALARPHSPLPFVLEPSYALEEVHMLLRAAMNNGVHLLPLGNQSVWDRFVPLEMPEIADMKVYPTDFDWYRPAVVAETAPAPVQEEPEPSIEGVYVLNGTTVNSLMPNLRVRLADLNEPSMIAPEDPPTVGTDSTVRTVQPAPRPKKSMHLKIKLLLTAVLTLVVAAIAVFLVLNGAPGTNNALPSAVAPLKPNVPTHQCPSDYNKEALQAGKDAKCDKCTAKLAEMESHKCEDATTPEAWKKASPYCGICREKYENNQKHTCPQGNNDEIFAALEEAKDYCPNCKQRWQMMGLDKHTCPVTPEIESMEEGKKFGCDDCTDALAKLDAHQSKCKGITSLDERKKHAAYCIECYNAVKKADQKSSSREGVRTLPNEQDAAQPAEDKSLNPNEQDAAQPAEDKSRNPNEQGAAQPAEDKSRNPNEQDAAQPAEDKSRNPNEQDAVQPAEDKSRNPNEQDAAQPAEDKSRNPNEQDAAQPAEDKSRNPNEQDAAQPAEDKSRNTNEQDAAQPAEDKSRNTNEQDAAQPAEDKSRNPSGQDPGHPGEGVSNDSVPVDPSTMRTRGTNTKQPDPRTASPKKNSDTELKNKFGKSDNRGSLKDKET
ncbi:MAG: hypothetical protein IJA63_00930 [Akkermansia sp.]|nr:hypothetical protein [Akkermansia sp.]